MTSVGLFANTKSRTPCNFSRLLVSLQRVLVREYFCYKRHAIQVLLVPGCRVLQALWFWFYRFYGSKGSRVLQVLWFYRFQGYGSAGSRVLKVQGSSGPMVLQVLGFYRFCCSIGSRVLQVL